MGFGRILTQSIHISDVNTFKKKKINEQLENLPTYNFNKQIFYQFSLYIIQQTPAGHFHTTWLTQKSIFPKSYNFPQHTFPYCSGKYIGNRLSYSCF